MPERLHSTLSGAHKAAPMGRALDLYNFPELDERAIQRFVGKFDRHESGCWIWKDKPSDRGYGAFGIKKRRYQAHRIAFLLYRGTLPTLTIDHLCRNRLCVNPLHLEAVTIGENVLRGVSVPAQNARKSHCQNGHPLSGENLRITGNGRRQCVTCYRAYARARRQLPQEKAKRRERDKKYRTGRPRGNRGTLNKRAKLTEEIVRAIRASTEPQAVVASRYGTTQVNVSKIKLRQAWSWLE